MLHNSTKSAGMNKRDSLPDAPKPLLSLWPNPLILRQTLNESSVRQSKNWSKKEMFQLLLSSQQRYQLRLKNNKQNPR
jgi:hypothetical protein